MINIFPSKFLVNRKRKTWSLLPGLDRWELIHCQIPQLHVKLIMHGLHAIFLDIQVFVDDCSL